MPLLILYFDTCALNRLSDDLSQPRIRTEASAVLRLLDLVGTHQLTWVASTVLEQEISRSSDSIRRLDTMNLLSLAATIVRPSPSPFTMRTGSFSRVSLSETPFTSPSLNRFMPTDSSPRMTA